MDKAVDKKFLEKYTTHQKHHQNKINKNNLYIWLMRQAGRYLPEYREIRKNYNFIDMIKNEKIIKKITLQPIKRFELNFVIIFTDILFLPYIMGDLEIFDKKVYRDSDYLIKLIHDFDKNNIKKKLETICNSIKNIKNMIKKDQGLIGFSGGFWTLLVYMIREDDFRNCSKTKKFLYKNYDEIKDKFSDIISEYLIEQIENGVNVIKIFESWAGVLSRDEFYDWIIYPTKIIIENIRKKFPDIDIIFFPRGCGFLYEDSVKELDIDVIALDYTFPLEYAKKNFNNIILQGNLNPFLLAYDIENALKDSKKILNIMNGEGFIFNLGHGILPDTPAKNVSKLIEFVRDNSSVV